MIIFNLDGTLADCDHRRHFVDKNHPKNNQFVEGQVISFNTNTGETTFYPPNPKFVPNWKAFYEACDKDELIESVETMFKLLRDNDFNIEIWSGRCESVRKKTENWLWDRNLDGFLLKMRPIGDSTPDDVLKEKWLDEAIAEGKNIDAVFDDRPKVVRMWNRRGIFVFDVGQGKGEF